MNRFSNWAGLIGLSWILPAALVGCGGNADLQAEEGPVGTQQASLSTYSVYSWGTNGTQPASTPIGTDPQTCFLSGVAGVLDSHSGAPGGLSSAFAGVSVDKNTGQWILEASGYTTGIKVGATAICLPTATNRTGPVGWSGGTPAKRLAPFSPSSPTRCGLLSVSNADPYYADSGWHDAGDSVQVYHVGGITDNDGWWMIGGTGSATGAAMCVDVTPGSGWWEFNYEAGTSTSNFSLLQAADQGTSPTGTQCWLTGVGGSFLDNSWTDGDFVTYDTGIQTWKLSLSPHKSGWVSCAR